MLTVGMGINRYNPIWDRRHNINLLGSYLFGEDQVWSFDARWNLGSGFPLTQTTGFYENIALQGNIGQDITTQNGILGIQYGGLGEGRLPLVPPIRCFKLKESFSLLKIQSWRQQAV